VLFPATGHRLNSYNVEGHSIADIKVDTPAPAPPPQALQQNPPQMHTNPPYPQYHQNHAPQASQPFVDPAILSMSKSRAAAPHPAQTVAFAPQEAPATPIKPTSSTAAASLSANTSPFVGGARKPNVRKPSAATLEGPFSSLDIADAEEPDTDDIKAIEATVRRASITKTRTGKPMEDPTVAYAARNEETWKRTRRGGKARKKEVAAQERRNGGDLPHSSPDAGRKGYVFCISSTIFNDCGGPINCLGATLTLY
jgi:enhancer of mRNA-decapping protein 3